MSESQKGYVLWGVNIIVIVLVGLLTLNANRICDTMDAQGTDIQTLKQESVRWGIMAEDVREIKGDMKVLLRKQ